MNATESVSIPTEEQVVAFFKAKLEDFQNRLPGYASIKLDVTRHPSIPDDFEIEWTAYHNDTGNSVKESSSSASSAIAWHFSHEHTKRKISELRQAAADSNRKADELEASIK